MKKHPVLFGFLLVSLVIICFYALAILSFSMFSDKEIGGGGLMVGDAVGVIEIRGLLLDSKFVLDQLIKFSKDSNIKSIVVRIDSPGGGVGPSQEIYREVQRINENKKVIASLGGTAASGGYYIACAAERIVANPGTLTGSIGVLMEFLNIEGLYKWVGLKSSVIKSGKYKDIGSPVREMSRDERLLLQGVIDNVYGQFVKAVSEGRGLEEQEVVKIADGRIFSGEQAMEMGLVDELGNFRDAVNLAAELGGIEGEPKLVYPRKMRRMNWIDFFIEESLSKVISNLLYRTEEAGLFYR